MLHCFQSWKLVRYACKDIFPKFPRTSIVIFMAPTRDAAVFALPMGVRLSVEFNSIDVFDKSISVISMQISCFTTPGVF